MVELNGLQVADDTANLYARNLADDDVLRIRTYYESQWLDRGLTIKYLSFLLPQQGELREPDVEIPYDTYRSFSRGQIQCPELCNNKD